jgi:hypothetical protein
MPCDDPDDLDAVVVEVANGVGDSTVIEERVIDAVFGEEVESAGLAGGGQKRSRRGPWCGGGGEAECRGAAADEKRLACLKVERVVRAGPVTSMWSMVPGRVAENRSSAAGSVLSKEAGGAHRPRPQRLEGGLDCGRPG